MNTYLVAYFILILYLADYLEINMTTLKSASFQYYIKSLPLKEEEVAYALASELEENVEDFDSFIFSLAEFVDFTKISSLVYLIRLSQLPIDQPFMKTIVEKSMNYISVLFSIPDSIDHTYTKGRLVFDCCDYLLYESYSFDWYNKFANLFELAEDQSNKDAVENFANVFIRISGIIEHDYLLTVNRYLAVLQNLIKPTTVRQAISSSPKFDEFIRNLFSQTVFATDSYELFHKFFEVETLPDLMKHHLDKLDEGLVPYRATLFQIMRTFLLSGTADNTLKAIQKCINSMKVIDQSSFAYTRSSQTKRIEAFSLNFESVIIQFLLLAKTKFSNINAYYPYLASSIAPITKETLTISRKDPLTEEEFINTVKKMDEEEKQTGKGQNAVTKFFFLAYQCLDMCSCSLLRLVNMISSRISRLMNAVQSRNINPMEKMFIEREIPKLKTNRNLIMAHLLIPSRITALNELFRSTLTYLVSLSGIKEQKIPDYPSPAYANLPDYIIGSLTMLLLVHFDNRMIDEPLFYLKNLVLLFSNKLYIERQEYKNNIIMIFSNISQDKHNSYLTIAVPHIAELMFPAILQFYCDVQVTDHTNSENHDRILYRDTCANLLIYWFHFREFCDYFTSHLSDQFVLDFIYYLVDGADYFGIHSLDLIRDIYNNAQDTNDPAAVSENQLNMTNLMFWLRNCNHSFNLMNSIVHFCPTAYNDPIIMDKVTKTTLSFINLFANHSEYIRAVLAQNPSIDYYSLFVSVLKFTIGCASNKEFIDTLLNNQMYAAEKMLPNAIDYLKKVRPGENTSLIETLSKFSNVINQRKVELDQVKINYDDAPDEFIDELTYDLMNEPMKLPSGQHIDVETLKTYLLTKQENPFTTTPMKFEDCVLDTELKQKIDEYKKRKQEEAKQKKA